METFLTGLFWDQRCRVQAMLDHLDKREYSAELPPDFLRETCDGLLLVRQHIDRLMDSQLLHFPDFNAGHAGKYSEWSELLKDAEFRYVVIRRYGDHEKVFARILSRIYTEIGLDQPRPVVSFISNAHEYYSASCDLGVIRAPIEEERHLLNWPDLYHEIGHFVFHKHAHFLLGQGAIYALVDAHFGPLIEKEEVRKRSKSAAVWREKQHQWRTWWLMEFTCDLIATYLTGPAFAWSNFRIASVLRKGETIYSSYPRHPSHEARMRAIFLMLSRCNWAQGEVAPVRSSWQTYTKLGLNKAPLNYALHTPEPILEALVECVFTECQAIGLRPYHQQPSGSVAGLLNEAWQTLLTTPTQYDTWEADQIRQLRATARQSL